MGYVPYFGFCFPDPRRGLGAGHHLCWRLAQKHHRGHVISLPSLVLALTLMGDLGLGGLGFVCRVMGAGDSGLGFVDSPTT